MTKRSRLLKSDERIVRRALAHLREDISEQKKGIIRDKKTINQLNTLL